MQLGHVKAQYAACRQSSPVKDAISAAANAGKPGNSLIESPSSRLLAARLSSTTFYRPSLRDETIKRFSFCHKTHIFESALSLAVSLIPKTVFSLVEPAIYSVAMRLFVLTSERAGSAKFHPTVATFYETGLVTSLYEQLLMSPVLQHLEIRHEMPYPTPGAGAPPRVDLWMRPVNGGYPHLVEAGDFGVGKVHADLRKIAPLNTNGSNWFLAFFRDPDDAADPMAVINTSLQRANGLDDTLVDVDQRLVKSFTVYRPNGDSDQFGVALFRGK